MDVQFTGKRALVTGAGKGIGREIVKALVRGGAEVVAVSRSPDTLSTLKDECPEVETINLDVSDWDATREKLKDVGSLDFLVNNAGVNVIQPFLEVTKDAYQTIMDINLRAMFNIGQIVGRGMVESGRGGAIVNMSSQASALAVPDHSVYCASKTAIVSLTKCMALELGPHQIRVNAVSPTIVMTDLGRRAWGNPEKGGPMLNRIPLGKFAEPQNVVDVVMFLLSDKASMVTGSNTTCDGGFTIC